MLKLIPCIKAFLTALALFDAALPMPAQQHLSLKEAIGLAQKQSVAAHVAENIQKNKAFQFQVFQAGLKPRLTFQAGIPTYSRDFFEVRQPDGGILFLPRAQNNAQVGFSLVQVIPQTGGILSLNTSFTRFDDFDRKFYSYTGTPVNITFEQPLFAFNPYKWNQKTEPIKLQEAQKDYVNQLEHIALQAVRLYFDVLLAQEQVYHAKLNLENHLVIQHIESTRIPLGATSREKILHIQLQVLRATQTRQEATVDLQIAQLNLHAYLGLPDNQDLVYVLPEQVPVCDIDPVFAQQQARENRPEYIGFQRRALESAREIAQYQLLRHQINLFVSLGFNGTGARPAALIHPLTDQQRLSLGLNIPILDWGRQKAQLGIATANAQVVAFTLEQEALNLRTAVINQVHTIKLLRTSIQHAQQTTAIADTRYQLALEQYQIGTVPLTDLHIALAEKDAAHLSYVGALRRFWEAYYILRQMTLFDFETMQKL